MKKTKVEQIKLIPGRFLKPAGLLMVLMLVLPLSLSACGEATPSPTSTTLPATATTVAATAGAVTPLYWPTSGWHTSTPEEQGVDSQQLLRTLQHIENDNINIRTLTVIRNGYIVLQAANQPYTLDMSYQVKSVTKSVISALTGIALKEGYLKSVKQTLVSFFPERTIANRDKNKEAITIEDLLTMRSGLDGADDKLNGALEASKDWVQFTLDLPMASPPGQQLVYNTAAVHLLSAILTKATGMSTSAYAQARLFGPLGIAPADISWQTDPQGLNIGGYGLFMKPQDMAKFGFLYLNDGKWENQQIIPADWVATSSTVHAIGENHKDYGHLFWVYPTHFAAEGLGEQMIQIVKNRNMVVVMTSAIDWHKGPVVLKLLQDYIIPAASSDTPLPPNPAALASLQDKVKYMANPVQPVQPLSTVALGASGKTYLMQDNPLGWKTISVTFEEGKPEALATVVTARGTDTIKSTVAVGLDNIYRLEPLDPGNFAARRGHWIDDHTLLVRQMQSWPDIEETEIRVDFSPEKLKIHAEEMVFGAYTYDFEGTVAPA